MAMMHADNEVGTSLPGDALTVGYLVPTRDAVTLGRHDARALVELGARAEALGFDAVWVGDSPIARARHDAAAMLAALAVRTERVALGSAVLLPALRHPLLLAQALATVDQLCDGRLIVGAGAGFPYPATERQFELLDVPFAGRVGRMVESVEAMRALWRAPQTPVRYAGRHVRLDGVALAPPPRRSGGPPIWLAGAGEAAERRVGLIGDGWLPYPPAPELYATAWRRVLAAAEEAGRPRPVPALYATIVADDDADAARARLRRSIERYYDAPLETVAAVQAMHAGTHESCRDWLRGYVDAGARHIVLRAADDDFARGLEAAAAVREELVEARVG